MNSIIADSGKAKTKMKSLMELEPNHSNYSISRKTNSRKNSFK